MGEEVGNFEEMETGEVEGKVREIWGTRRTRASAKVAEESGGQSGRPVQGADGARNRSTIEPAQAAKEEDWKSLPASEASRKGNFHYATVL